MVETAVLVVMAVLVGLRLTWTRATEVTAERADPAVRLEVTEVRAETVVPAAQ